MEIRAVFSSDPPQVFREMAEIHRAVITEGFLSSFGPSFLTGLYRSLCSSSNAFTYGAFDEGLLVGFIVGSVDTGMVYKDFARTGGVRALFTLLPKLLSFQRLKRVFETVVYPNRKRKDDLPEPEILNFCVRGEQQGTGVGTQLFQALVGEFSRRGVPQIRIVTGETQESAQAFYEKRGARLVASTEIHEGTRSRVYVFDIV